MADGIPMVDFSKYGLQVDDKKSVAQEDLQDLHEQIYSALSGIGFCYLMKNGFPADLVGKLNKVTREFFDQPASIKSQFARNVDTHNGWVALERESLNPDRPGDYKEAYNYSPSEKGLKWPEFLPDFKMVHSDFFAAAIRITERILDVLFTGLKLEDPNFLINCHKFMGRSGNGTTLRSLFYPPVPACIKKDQIRCGEHSDYGTVSLIFQDEHGGLGLQTRDGRYITAPYVPDTIIVINGDLLQQWTGDKLLATKHRVLFPEEEFLKKQCRMSIVFFVNPDDDVVVKCLDGSDKYEPTKSPEYILSRYSVTN